MQPTDLNAHAAPWQGPRPTSTARTPGASPGSGASHSHAGDEAPNGFVLHDNVTNSHVADQRGTHFNAGPPQRIAAPRHPWWGAAQLQQHTAPHRANWSKRAAFGVFPARPDANASTAPQDAASPAPQPTSGVASTTPSSKPTQPARSPSEARSPAVTPASQGTQPSSLIFDGRLHRNTRPLPTSTGPLRTPVGLHNTTRSQSSGSETSTPSDAPKHVASKVVGPLGGSESVLFDPSSIVRPSVTPAAVMSAAPISMLRTPPLDGVDLLDLLPSPMPYGSDEDFRPSVTPRVVIDVADLLEGLDLRPRSSS